jgi:PAS domain S-box-containing protein
MMDEKKGFIICVDDQPEIVDVLLMQLENAIGTECEIEVAESAHEALEVLRELSDRGEVIELVITDEIMPGLQGSKFLEMVHKHDPDIMTMLLTGQAGLNDVVYAVNHARLAKCLKKPWEYDELRDTVKELVAQARLNRRNKQLDAEVVAEKNKAEAIVHSIADGILVIDSDDKISLVNEACVDILGRSEEELLGMRILEALKVKELILLHMEAAQRSGEVISDEIVLPKPGEPGSNLVIIAVARTLRDKDGLPLGVVTVLRDITREKEVSAMKANFLATVSHELRTPLTSIISTFELLLQDALGELTQEQREFITTSKEQGNILSELIDNIIDLSNLESNQIELTPERLDLESIALELSTLIRKAAWEKGLTFSLDIEPDLPEIVADKANIERMLKILLSNAVKFTKEGSLTLRIHRTSEWKDVLASESESEAEQPSQPAEDGIQFSVIDTGIGIAPDNFEKIFEKFYQVDSSITREFRGSGLGLSICKAIVNAHHGHIWIESTLEQGSSFHVMLPVKRET